MCGCLSLAPLWGPGPQPRHVPRLGLNQRPFPLQSAAQSIEPHQLGLNFLDKRSFTLLLLFGFVTDSKKLMSILGVVLVGMFLWHKIHILSHSLQ